MQIIRGRLSPQDYGNTSIRYNSTTDTVEFSPDNGATWVDAPSADPRHSSIFLKPPLATMDARCDSAAGKVKWIKDFLDSLTALLVGGATAFGLVNVALGVLSSVFPPSALVLLVVNACETLFGIGATALTAALTNDQYDLLLCIFLCNASLDGTVDADKLATIETLINDQLNTTAALVINLVLSIQGEVGLSNAGVVEAVTGDCSDCDDCEWCFDFNFAVDTYSFVALTDGGRPKSIFSAGAFRSIFVNYCSAIGDNAMANQFGRLMPAINLTKVEVYGDGYYYDPSSLATPNIQLLQNGTAFDTFAPTGTFKHVWEGSMIQTGSWNFAIGGVLGYRHCAAGSAIGGGNISRMVWHGIGATNPFGSDNCE